MQAKVLSVLVVAFLFVVVAVLHRAMRNAFARSPFRCFCDPIAIIQPIPARIFHDFHALQWFAGRVSPCLNDPGGF